jgi:hypothetical protein
MNQTIFEPIQAGDEGSATQSLSGSSQPKSSDSSKAADKKTKKSKSSAETPEEREKRKREKKEKKQRKKEKKERKEKESKSKDSSETPEEKAQRRQAKKERKEKESKSKDMIETPEEKAQRRKERKENKKEKKNGEKERDSKVQKKDEKAEQQQKLDISEKLQCRSLSSENVTQATDVDSYLSDDGSMHVSVMMDPHFGEQVEILDGSLTDDHASEEETLMCMVNTLRRRLEEVESENRQLNENNMGMQALEIQLIRAEEQLEHAAEEKHDLSTRIHALEEALVVQETELDNTPVTVKPIIFEAGPIGMLLGTTVNDQACRVDGFVDGGPDDPSQARKSGKIQMGDVIVSVNGIVPDSYEDTIDLLKEGGTRVIVFRGGTQDDNYDDDYLSTEGTDDGLVLFDEMKKFKKDDKKEKEAENDKKIDSLQLQLAYHEELAVVKEELNQLRHERDRAIDKASELTIESGKCKDEVSKAYDRVAECQVVIEQLRAMLLDYSTQQSSSASVCSVSKPMDLRSSIPSISGLPLSIGWRKLGSLWGNINKNDDKLIMSTYDDDCMLDTTEDNTSVASEEDWELEQIDTPTQPSVAFG